MITNLYTLCISSLLQGLHRQSCFYAEKLLFLCNEVQVQSYFVYLFGVCLLNNGQYSSVSKLISRYQMLGSEFKILQAQALLGNKQYELCLEVLEGETNFQSDWVRGQCYEMLENKKEAMYKYQECIQKQPVNVCAMEKLVDSFLMSQSEKEHLVSSLELSNEEQWIKEYYKNKIEMQRGGGQNLYIQENLNEEKKKVLA